MTRGFLLVLHAVCPLLFFTDLTRNPYAVQGVLLQSGLLLAASWEAASALRRGAWTRRPTLLDAPVLSFAGVALLSWILSWRAHASVGDSVLWEGLRGNLFLLSNLVLPFFLAARLDAARDPRYRRTVLAVGAVAAAYGLFQYFGAEWVWDKALNPYNGRPVSTFGNPNFLSSYLVMLLPLALHEFLSARPAARPGWGALILLFGAALITTMTRSSWIGAAVAMGLFLWLARPRGRERWRGILFLVGALAVMALAWPGSPLSQGDQSPLGRAVELVKGVAGKGIYGSWHQRLLIWSCSWDMFKDRALLGQGWGCFELFYPFYQGRRLDVAVFQGFRTHANNAHNVALEVLSQTGLLGLSVLLWGVVLLVLLLRRRAASLPPEDRSLAWAGAAALAGMAADNFFGNVSLFFAVPGFLFAWTAGGLAVQAGGAPSAETSLRRPAPLAAAALFIMAALAGVVWIFRGFRAEAAFFEGYKRSHRGDIAGAARYLEASRRWRRYEVNNAYELGNLRLHQGKAAAQAGLHGQARLSLEKAVSAYDEALAANAGYDEIHFNKASALLSLGRSEEALAHLKTSLLINPLHQEGHRLMASFYAQGDPLLEAAAFAAAVGYFPRHAPFWIGLGRARSRAGAHVEAAEAFARALALDVDSKEAAEGLRAASARAGLPPSPLLSAPVLAAQAREAAGMRRWDRAREKAEALAVLAPEWPLSWLMAADMRVETGAEAEALPAYDTFLSFEPGHKAARLNKARALLRLGRREEARAEARWLLRHDPSDPDAAAFLSGL